MDLETKYVFVTARTVTRLSECLGSTTMNLSHTYHPKKVLGLIKQKDNLVKQSMKR